MRSTVPLTKMNLVMSDSEKWKLRLFHRWARLFSEPVIRLSIPITSCPSASRWSVRCEPRNPAAPVTTHLIVLLQCGFCSVVPIVRLTDAGGDCDTS